MAAHIKRKDDDFLKNINNGICHYCLSIFKIIRRKNVVLMICVECGFEITKVCSYILEAKNFEKRISKIK